jgi:hypothetical protein
MSDTSPDRRTAVRLPESPERRAALRQFLASSDLTICSETRVGLANSRSDCGISGRIASHAVEFLPKDDDELNQLACAGRFHTIIYASLNDLLNAIWKGDADWSAWRRANIQIDLAEVPELAAADWRHFVDEMYGSLEEWRKADRRRTIIAAVVLSILALVATACLLWFARSP